MNTAKTKATRATKPTEAEMLAAADRLVLDVVAPGLRVLFCGINPSLYSAATGHHFARPGNRFWRALHLAGFTSRQLAPGEDRELLRQGLGITNVVARASRTAAEVSTEEFVAGGLLLKAKIKRFRPRALAVLGVTAYRTAFAQPKAVIGAQAEKLGGALVWVLPNPSGLNAHYRVEALAQLYGELRRAIEDDDTAAAQINA